MNVVETSKVGASVLEGKGSILIGLSVKNSYFKDENLKEILNWAYKHSESVFIMIPDKPAISTLMSLGYPENRAKTKAGLEANRLENKCKRISKEDCLNSIKIIRWCDIEEKQNYREMLEKIKSAYDSDIEFRKELQDTTLEVIEGHGTTLETDKAIEIGVNFLFQELALISNASQIFDLEQVAYLYHKTMPVFKALVEGRYSLRIPKDVGYITAR